MISDLFIFIPSLIRNSGGIPEPEVPLRDSCGPSLKASHLLCFR